jgi:hypothetical protein
MAGITWSGLAFSSGQAYPFRSNLCSQKGGRPVSGSRWHTITGVDRSALSEARLQAHYATQWLAKTARACVMTRPDDHHTNLGWDDALGGLITHPLPQGSVLGLRISDLTLLLWDGSRLAGAPSIGLEGRNDSDIRQWLGRQLSQKGLDAHALDAPSPYRMPEHAIGHGAPYGLAQSRAKPAPALAELAAWFANASLVLGETRQRIVGRGIDAPPVRCWPHHFDLDSLIALPAGAGTVGLGFCPGDDYYDQPYFYVSRHPAPDVAALAPLPPVGHWHTHHFTAAVAVADRIVAGGDPQAATEAFLRAATDILIHRA